MKKFFTWLIDKWLAGAITATIFYLINLYNKLPEESKNHFFSFNWLTEILYKHISLWVVIVVVTTVIIVTRIEKRIWKLKNQSKKDDYAFLKAPEASFADYKTDTFGINNTVYTWNYEWNGFEQTFHIKDIKPSCPICGTPMEPESFSRFSSPDSATCHKCRLEGRRYSFQLNENLDDIQKEIIIRSQGNN